MGRSLEQSASNMVSKPAEMDPDCGAQDFVQCGLMGRRHTALPLSVATISENVFSQVWVAPTPLLQ